MVRREREKERIAAASAFDGSANRREKEGREDVRAS